MILYRRDYFIFGGFFLYLIANLLYVAISVNHSTQGVEVAELQRQIDELRKENSLLQEKILHEMALTTIEQRAFEMGFRPIQQSDYIYLR